MKVLFAALALALGLSSVSAIAGQICDINGCHEASGSEEFWNEWYLKHYGHPYDAGYREHGQYGTPGTGRCHGYGAGGRCPRERRPKQLITCSAKDYTKRVIAKGASSRQNNAIALALQECQSRSASPRTCKVVKCVK